MSQFSFYNDVNSCVRMDEPITRGPQPRWLKKPDENCSSTNITNNSLNTSKSFLSLSMNSSQLKSPSKGISAQLKKTPRKTPSKTPKKTPKKSPGVQRKTPTGGDRFIPIRSEKNFELGHFKLTSQDHEDDEMKSPSQLKVERIMRENLLGTDVRTLKFLAFEDSAPETTEGVHNPLKVAYSHSKTKSASKSTVRFIPQAPDKILDAPDILDDYYLNLVDWSASNLLAVALGSAVYLWNANTGSIEHLLTLDGSDYVCSVAWMQEGGTHLAVGNSFGTVQLWDCTAMKRVRSMASHSSRVGSLSWNSYVLSTGCRTGQISHHDVRQREHLISSVTHHTQEVCGLKWSPDGRFLASGGNDNLLCVWAAAAGERHSQPRPLHVFDAHAAAVKALAWCPWQRHVLASGGGTADRTIRFWNCNTGVCLQTLDTKSQVTAIQWSLTYKELVSGHGFANNQLIIWNYPALTKVAELTGHMSRVLQLAISPDGSTVLSAGADETLRLWTCFLPDPAKKKDVAPAKTESRVLNLLHRI
ncbi:cell division cycle protein 20 homolog isoform X2 [Bacillus rossius redtenbacheri]|uniref:cell division cycle protein 20 homolog isoform X2 n=1 Tax=Bacillus rossius redtenbacheri TaxID=93214 RepID=UPI002FDD85FD